MATQAQAAANFRRMLRALRATTLGNGRNAAARGHGHGGGGRPSGRRVSREFGGGAGAPNPRGAPLGPLGSGGGRPSSTLGGGGAGVKMGGGGGATMPAAPRGYVRDAYGRKLGARVAGDNPFDSQSENDAYHRQRLSAELSGQHNKYDQLLYLRNQAQEAFGKNHSKQWVEDWIRRARRFAPAPSSPKRG